MLENKQLGLISPEETILDGVLVNQKDEEVKFAYRIADSVDISLQTIGTGLLLLSIVALVIFLVHANLHVAQTIRDYHRAPQTSVVAVRNFNLDI